ncbi:MAG: NAD-dependent epimerase/dehydratase family protein [Deltaproteobacteria bacterium]|nr:NAD-dependent epimerase/dehydratase family protein [Deltaproteobacteria bacterium]
MKAVVTGALGFIGSTVTDLLIENGHSVVGIDNLSTGFKEYANPRAEYIYQDCSTFKNYSDFDWCFHLAAWPRIQPSFEELSGHDENNIGVTIKILENIQHAKKKPKIIYSSSSAIYGDSKEFPTTENSPIAPLSPYALQKYTSECYVELLAKRWSSPYACLRYFNVYGPRSFNEKNKWNAYTSVIGIFHRQATSTGIMTVTGDGEQRRDFVHVRDVALANLRAAESGIGAFNVGIGQAYSVLEIAKKFQKIHSAKIEFIPERKGEAFQTLADSSRLQSIGWKPEWTLDRAIEQASL